MNEPDYTRMTAVELLDVARHIDGVRFAERAARLYAEIERRKTEGEPELPERNLERAERRQLFSRNAALCGLAGACSFPISFLLLAAIAPLGSGRVSRSPVFDSSFAFWTVPLGWLLGVAAGVSWTTLRLQREEGEINTFELWRDAISAAVAAALCGCLFAPFLATGLVMLLSVAFLIFIWLVSSLFG